MPSEELAKKAVDQERRSHDFQWGTDPIREMCSRMEDPAHPEEAIELRWVNTKTPNRFPRIEPV